MVRYYLNRDVEFKSNDKFSCVYHKRTGWYYPCKPDFWKSLQTYKGGRDLNPEKLTPALQELVQNRFLIERKTRRNRDLQGFYPIIVPGTVYLDEGSTIDVAVERKGAHNEVDFDVITLEGEQALLWRLCCGTMTIQEIQDKFEGGLDRVFSILKEWAAIEFQIVRLLPIPANSINKMPPQFAFKAPFLPKKSGGRESDDDVHRYHLEVIKDSAEQFERIESTVSHLYRIPHPILDWKSYGGALLSKVASEKEIKSGMRVLEVGGGAGNISADILKELKEKNIGVEYTIYDLSPALIRSQKALHKKIGVRAEHIHGNGEILALKDSCVDIAISNEVIADFYTPEVNTSEVEDFLFDHQIPMSPEFFHFYRGAPEKVRVNLGAFMLLKELYRVLKPEGLAVITEFGYQDRLPFRAGHLDHAEYSIQFGQAVSVAAALGFNLYLTDVFDFLGFRTDVLLMTHYSFQSALRILEHHQSHLPNITYTEELFKKQLGKKAAGFRGMAYVEPNKDPFKVVKVMVCRKPLDPDITPELPPDPA